MGTKPKSMATSSQKSIFPEILNISSHDRTKSADDSLGLTGNLAKTTALENFLRKQLEPLGIPSVANPVMMRCSATQPFQIGRTTGEKHFYRQNTARHGPEIGNKI
jgi:hypothetical protein